MLSLYFLGIGTDQLPLWLIAAIIIAAVGGKLLIDRLDDQVSKRIGRIARLLIGSTSGQGWLGMGALLTLVEATFRLYKLNVYFSARHVLFCGETLNSHSNSNRTSSSG